MQKINKRKNFTFDGKTKLTKYIGTEADVVIPKGVKTIEAFAFLECSHIRSVSYIGNAKKIIIPNSVTEIGERAFYENNTLVALGKRDFLYDAYYRHINRFARKGDKSYD